MYVSVFVRFNSHCNSLKTKRNLLYIRSQSVPRCKHFPPRLKKTSQLMTYKAKVAVCSEIRIKPSTQSEHHVDFFLILSLVVSKDTTRLLYVN
jgi:hypothetical protein